MIVALRPAREAAGITQRELAERAGVTPRTVIRIEGDAGHAPSIFTVKALAMALGVTLDDLVHDPEATASPDASGGVVGGQATPVGGGRRSQKSQDPDALDSESSGAPGSRRKRA